MLNLISTTGGVSKEDHLALQFHILLIWGYITNPWVYST